MGEAVRNLYVHFPFCRRKCTYCALLSRAGSQPELRAAYVARLSGAVRSIRRNGLAGGRVLAPSTIYFGGGSPALCDLQSLFSAVSPLLAADGSTEFTVELHPLDATRENLQRLRDGGVNRISMGVQSLDDRTLEHMGRGCTFSDAERAFALVREYFDNAGIDLIVGYPSIGQPAGVSPRYFDSFLGVSPQNSSFDARPLRPANKLSPRWERLTGWGLRHCSVYSLILEEKSILSHILAKGNGVSPRIAPRIALPSDEDVLDQIKGISRFLAGIGLNRYEISNYAAAGFECRHNLATWQGEDYVGLGTGAHGRIGLLRTRNWWGETPPSDVYFWGEAPETESVSAEKDEIERRIFSLRTRYGLKTAGHPEWTSILDRLAAEGLLTRTADAEPAYRLTERGTEVCDSILAELI